MKCQISGVGHDLVMPNFEIIYRDTCDDTITGPVITETVGVTGQCNRRIITIPCNGCEKCRQIKSYGCRIKDCTLEDGRNTKIRVPFLLELDSAGCSGFNNCISSNDPYDNIDAFATQVCTCLEAEGITGLSGDVIISGPLPAFEEPYTVATINNGNCTPEDIPIFTSGMYRLENCGGETMFTITNSSMP